MSSSILTQKNHFCKLLKDLIHLNQMDLFFGHSLIRHQGSSEQKWDPWDEKNFLKTWETVDHSFFMGMVETGELLQAMNEAEERVDHPFTLGSIASAWRADPVLRIDCSAALSSQSRDQHLVRSPSRRVIWRNTKRQQQQKSFNRLKKRKERPFAEVAITCWPWDTGSHGRLLLDDRLLVAFASVFAVAVAGSERRETFGEMCQRPLLPSHKTPRRPEWVFQHSWRF